MQARRGKFGRATLRWSRVSADPRVARRYQLYSTTHEGRRYRLFLDLSTQEGRLEDWSCEPRHVVARVRATASRSAQAEAEECIFRYVQQRYAELAVRTAPTQGAITPAPAVVGPHPLVLLRLHLIRLQHEALRGEVGMYQKRLGNEAEVQHLARLLSAADKSLTGCEPVSPSRHTIAARALLDGSTLTLPLSDGGYSRLHLSILETPPMRLDPDLRSVRAQNMWDSVFPGSL